MPYYHKQKDLRHESDKRHDMQGDNMFQLFGTRLASSQGAYILIAAALMIPTMWLPDVKALSFLGIFGFGATLTVMATVRF